MEAANANFRIRKYCTEREAESALNAPKFFLDYASASASLRIYLGIPVRTYRLSRLFLRFAVHPDRYLDSPEDLFFLPGLSWRHFRAGWAEDLSS